MAAKAVERAWQMERENAELKRAYESSKKDTEAKTSLEIEAEGLKRAVDGASKKAADVSEVSRRDGTEDALISKVEAENEGLKRSVEASQKESAESKEAGAMATQRALPKRERMLSRKCC